MATIEKSIDVGVPVSMAYDQWTQFEEFPQFMEGIVEVKQLDDTHLHWVADIDGERTEWKAEVTEQEPDRVDRLAIGRGAREQRTGRVRADRQGNAGVRRDAVRACR